MTQRRTVRLLAVASALLCGCATQADTVSTSEHVNDVMINTRVKSEIFAEPTLKGSVFDVTTRKGTVRLSGYVHSEAASGTATAAAQRIAGVTSVLNELRLKAPQ